MGTVDMHRLRDTKTELVANIISANIERHIGNLLVVGCGSGVEAAILSRCLKADVIGIDVENNFDPESARQAVLQYGDAMSIPFDDNSFDFVYSYHALEHIPEPKKALSEMARVLRPGGWFWIGTPNRWRVLGYLGSKTATFSEKVRWNYIDWKARLSGKFRNEYGAHAGFSAKELETMLIAVFPVVNNVTDTYFSTLYSRHGMFIRLIRLSGLSRFIYPSVYFLGNS
jgi:ubiquinone/menaquinone biosynthesis C-methylase UbiE